MAHTALPWEAKAVQHDEVDIFGPEGVTLELATVYSVNDAAFILRAVNNHDALLSALEHIGRILDTDQTNLPAAMTLGEIRAIFTAQARAAILAAKGD